MWRVREARLFQFAIFIISVVLSLSYLYISLSISSCIVHNICFLPYTLCTICTIYIWLFFSQSDFLSIYHFLCLFALSFHLLSIYLHLSVCLFLSFFLPSFLFWRSIFIQYNLFSILSLYPFYTLFISLSLPYICPCHISSSIPLLNTTYRALISRSMHTLVMIISCSTIAVDKSRLHISAAFTQTQTHTANMQTKSTAHSPTLTQTRTYT